MLEPMEIHRLRYGGRLLARSSADAMGKPLALERGKLQDLIFDNQALASHRAIAAIFAVILKLPLLKQVMASQQMK
jgi:hypothetical protein